MPSMTERDLWERDELLRLLGRLRTLMDLTSGRGDVTGLEHCLQTADRARKAGADSELVLVALVHDAGKPLSETNHGAVIAEMLGSRVSRRALLLLRVHSELQAFVVHSCGGVGVDWSDDAKRLAAWDAASFDAGYSTPPLEEFLPLIDQLYRNEFAPLQVAP